jgi:hypothetical protein
MAEHWKKYQICMQDKLHAGQYSHFPLHSGIILFVVGATYFLVDVSLEGDSLAAAPPPPLSDDNAAVTATREGDGHYFLLHP